MQRKYYETNLIIFVQTLVVNVIVVAFNKNFKGKKFLKRKNHMGSNTKQLSEN